MSTAPTLREVARLARVSVATASRCLSGRSKGRSASMKRIQAAATKIGYTHNNLVGEVMRSARKGNLRSHLGTLCYLTLYENSSAWRHDPTLLAHWESASERAESLGFKVEEFVLSKSGISEDRLSDILWARGIRGILIAPLPREPVPLNLRWEDFAAVCVGHESEAPRLDCVVCYLSEGVTIAARTLRERGYKRIGLAIEKYQDAITNHAWSSSYAAYRATAGEGEDIPLFIPDRIEKAGFLQWQRRYKPDAILTLSTFRNEANPMVEWLKSERVTVPGDVAIATLDCTSVHADWAGIFQHSVEIGTAAADLLLSKLRVDSVGIPRVPRTLHIHGEWRDGATVRPS